MSLKPTRSLGSARAASKSILSAIRHAPLPPREASTARTPGSRKASLRSSYLHLILWKECRLVGIHGPLASWSAEYIGPASVEALRRSIMTAHPVVVASNEEEPTADLTTTGRTSGRLLGGNLTSIATSAGWALPSLDGAILLLEAIGMGLGDIERQLTMLANAGHLAGVEGVAVGQFTNCGTHNGGLVADANGVTAVDILRDRLSRLNVPILGGLPIGHGKHPATVPLGTHAILDAGARLLQVERRRRLGTVRSGSWLRKNPASVWYVNCAG